MKIKSILTTSSLLCLSASIYAANIDIYPKNVTIPDTSLKSTGLLSGGIDDILVLYPTVATPDPKDTSLNNRYDANSGSTVKGMMTAEGYSNAMCLILEPSKALTVDVNSVDARDVMAIDFSQNFTRLAYMHLKVTNSNADATDATRATVKFKELEMYYAQNNAGQKQTLTFDKGKFLFEAPIVSVGDSRGGAKGYLDISQNANVEYKGNMTVYGNGNLSVNGTMWLSSGSKITVNKDGQVNLGSNRYIFKSSEKTGKGDIVNSGTMTSTADCLDIYDNFTNYGSFIAKTGLYLYNGVTFTAAAGSTTTITGNAVPKVIIADGSTLVLEESIVGSNGYYIDIANITGSTAKIKINGDVTIGRINQGNIGNGLIHIVLSDTGILRFNHLENNVISLYKGIDIYNFREGSIFLGTDLSESILEDISKIKLFEGDVGSEDFVVAQITADGWLTAVPEPAEWAAIFGGIALALAIYRRRK